MSAAAQDLGTVTRFRRFLVSDHVAGWAFILPSVILIVLFGIVPIVWGLVLSFQRAGLISPEREWVGFENYARIASDPKARQAAIKRRSRLGVQTPLS